MSGRRIRVAAFAEHDLLVVAEADLPHDNVVLVKLAGSSPSCRVHTAILDLEYVFIKYNQATVQAAGDERIVEQLQLSTSDVWS